MRKGFFSFALILFLIPVLFILIEIKSASTDLLDYKNLAIELEQSNLSRTELEQNLDNFFLEFLEEKANSNETNSKELKKEFIPKLKNFLFQLQSKNSNIEFFLSSSINNNIHSVILHKQEITEEKLENCFSLNLINIAGKKKIQLTFTGSEERLKLVALIKTNNSTQLFFLPLNYTLEVLH